MATLSEMTRIASKTICRVFLALNYVALLVACCGFLYASVPASDSGRFKVVELDRMRVINSERLRAYKPDLADDIRNKLGEWIQQKEHDAAVSLSLWLGGFAVLNILGYHVLTARA